MADEIDNREPWQVNARDAFMHQVDIKYDEITAERLRFQAVVMKKEANIYLKTAELFKGISEGSEVQEKPLYKVRTELLEVKKFIDEYQGASKSKVKDTNWISKLHSDLKDKPRGYKCTPKDCERIERVYALAAQLKKEKEKHYLDLAEWHEGRVEEEAEQYAENFASMMNIQH